jgi:hypothetical protein
MVEWKGGAGEIRLLSNGLCRTSRTVLKAVACRPRRKKVHEPRFTLPTPPDNALPVFHRRCKSEHALTASPEPFKDIWR